MAIEAQIGFPPRELRRRLVLSWVRFFTERKNPSPFSGRFRFRLEAFLNGDFPFR